ncbi:hypothetical protein C799_02867 [Bacteroides thetaiotaomicron dnLKV9]|uniref:Uncharacterized protein n=1 Tax=Bacteroides thetaiotaomicron dnLKV9 TaxID=1235785 RepID=R9HAR5_BACT4|nr:hypothetical protein [Bacteroides thetaiotaomicron]EOS01014.1 hypothetical protein C799_02867 [Bacteroides thetaiotaomicron dnLKV9]
MNPTIRRMNKKEQSCTISRGLDLSMSQGKITLAFDKSPMQRLILNYFFRHAAYFPNLKTGYAAFSVFLHLKPIYNETDTAI